MPVLIPVALIVAAWLCYRLLLWIRIPARDLNDVTDPKNQLAFVAEVAFERRPLLNRSEFPLLELLEGVVDGLQAGHRVMAQTCLGEIIKPKPDPSRREQTDLAFRSINSKRADFVIVDARGLAVVVVEYQGRGHYQGTAALRDAVKKEAFRSAGIRLVEVPACYEKADIAREIREILTGYAMRAINPAA